MIDEAITELTPLVGVRAACAAVGRPRASHYRRHRPAPAPRPPRPEPKPQPRALTQAERQEVLDLLHAERFVDLSPAEVWAILLDEGRYLCSEATMYRLLRQTHGEVRDRRRHAVHPPRVKPELVAHAPNECWSWDITKLAGPAKWTYYYLLVTWNQAAWRHRSRRRWDEHDDGGADDGGASVAGVGSLPAGCGVVAGVGGSGSGASHDRRVFAGAGGVPALV